MGKVLNIFLVDGLGMGEVLGIDALSSAFSCLLAPVTCTCGVVTMLLLGCGPT